MLAIYSLNVASGQSFHIQSSSLNADGTITVVYDSSTTNSTFTVIFRALFRKL